MEELSDVIGRRLDGNYQKRLTQMKANIRQQQHSSSMSTLQPTEVYSSSIFSKGGPLEMRSAIKQRSTIPQSMARRDSHLLPKQLSEYQLGYSQRIGQSHQLLPKNIATKFGSQVTREKVYFLKEQTKVFDNLREVNQKKHFQNLTNEMNQYQPGQLKSQQLLYKNYDTTINVLQEKAKTDGRRLRKNFQSLIVSNDKYSFQ